jgi:FkbM family methyltransferase
MININFFRTAALFWKNPFINPYQALWRHFLWQMRKVANRFPCDLRFPGFVVRIADRMVANGPGALLNAMGLYDPNNMLFLIELFRRKLCFTFYDVGANIGVYSLMVASSQAEATVCAFEPHPYTYSLLRENIMLNRLDRQIITFQSALGSKNGLIKFTDMPGSAVNKTVEDGYKQGKTIEVEIWQGDAIVHRTNIMPDVIKIDVEGLENEVLHGFIGTLLSTKMVFVECQDLPETSEMLCNQFGFSGPFRVDYRAKRLAKIAMPPWEDWLFIQPEFLPSLRSIGFTLFH